MTPSRLGIKITAPIVLVSALALGLTVFLNVGKLERTLGEVQESRLRFTLNELRTNLETGLDLGLTLDNLGNAEAALDFQARQDPDILSISVIDTAGAVIFNSGAAPVLKPGSQARFKERDWLAREPGSITLGSRLSNNFGATVGAVVLRYSVAKQDAVTTFVSRELTLAAVSAVVLMTLCLWFGIHALVRRMNRTLAAMEERLGAEPGAVDGADRYAAALVDQVNLTTRTAMHEVNAARDALREHQGIQ